MWSTKKLIRASTGGANDKHSNETHANRQHGRQILKISSKVVVLCRKYDLKEDFLHVLKPQK